MYPNERLAHHQSHIRSHSSLSDLNTSRFNWQPVGRHLDRPPSRLQSEHNLHSPPTSHDYSPQRSKSFSMFYWGLGNRSMDQHFPCNSELSEWIRFQPLSILQLDPADRIVLFIAGKWTRLVDLLSKPFNDRYTAIDRQHLSVYPSIEFPQTSSQ